MQISHIASIMLKIAYGSTPDEDNDYVILLTEKAIAHLSDASNPASFLVNQFHFRSFF